MNPYIPAADIVGPAFVRVAGDAELDQVGLGYTHLAYEVDRQQVAQLLEGATLIFSTEEGGSVAVRLER